MLPEQSFSTDEDAFHFQSTIERRSQIVYTDFSVLALCIVVVHVDRNIY